MVVAKRLEVQVNGRAFPATDELHWRKLQVLAKFVGALLAMPEGKPIAKIILYGSVARGEADEDSDVDVLLFTTGSVQPLERAAQAAAWEVMVTTTEHVAVIVFPLNDFYYPTDFFLLATLREGKEIFAMTETDIRRETAKDNLELALDYVETAELSRASRKIRAAIDAANNAAELAAKSFLLLEGGKLPTRHGRVIGQFSDVFIIKKQLIPPDRGRALNLLLEQRHKARYVWKAELTDDMAVAGIALARDLLERLRQYLADTIELTESIDEQENDS